MRQNKAREEKARKSEGNEDIKEEWRIMKKKKVEKRRKIVN